VYAFILIVFLCVYIAALLRADPPSGESYRLYIAYETEKVAKVQRAVESVVLNELACLCRKVCIAVKKLFS
jgi:hypothetical protein